jgi:menaquinone-dependent protoporphyrinogen oxidase
MAERTIPARSREIVVRAERVLVAFASRSGSTAGIAQAIAVVLRNAGLSVDSRPAGDVTDVIPYAAVVLGSGVFLPRRASDGGGFLARHVDALSTRAVWLYCAGPIGRGRGADGERPEAGDDCSVAEVARAVGARGCAAFGTAAPARSDDPFVQLVPVDLTRVRAWAHEIATELAADPAWRPAPGPTIATRARRPVRCSRATASG